MNKKLIAAAVSAAVVAPVAAYGEVTVYGRINNAIDINDLDDRDDADSKTHVSSVSSRFGIKYNKEMGNGLSAHGRYEFSTTTDNETGINDLRIGTVGVSGPFGRVDIGNQWSAYSNTFGTLISPTYTLGYYLYSSIGGGLFRSSNTIKYSNSFGPVYVALDIRLNDEDSAEQKGAAENARGDGVGLGVSWAVTDSLTIAAAYDNEDGEEAGPGADLTSGVEGGDTADDVAERAEEDRLGISGKATFGNYWVSAGWQSFEQDNADDDEVDTVFLYGGGNFGENTSWMLGYAEADVDNDDVNDDPEQMIWAIYHNLGGGLKLYYEAVSLDIEAKDQDGARHLIGMRVDF